MSNQTSIERGQGIVNYTRERRHKLAKGAQFYRRIRQENAETFAGMSDESRAAYRHSVHKEAARLRAKAPARLVSRRDIVLRARALRRWVSDVRNYTDWDSLWCGQQDALYDRIDAARQDANDLRAYARHIRPGGES